MKSAAIFASALLAGAGTSAHAGDTAQNVCMQRAQDILSALHKGDYATATAHFDARMLAALNAGKLQSVWHDVLPAQVGAFDHAATTTLRETTKTELAETPLKFARAWLTMRVACNADGTVGGLFFAPGSAPASEAAAVPSNERPLAVSSPLGPLPGTLDMPQGDGPFPAVLLVAGSGPNDRDETIGPNKPFADIAHGLAEQGIATFRYDKRTRVYGAQIAGRPITIDDEVTDDAIAALKLLAQQPNINPHRIFVLGHSLGAFAAPRIAAHDSRVAGTILLAAPATFDLDTVVRQTRYLARIEHATPQQTQAALAPIEAARDAIARADPKHPPTGEFFHAPASYWLSLRGYDPIAVSKNLKQPILVLQGTGDYQVTPTADFAKWQATFARDPRVTLKEYPGLSHLFMAAGDPPSPADYAKAGHVDARVIADIAAWIAAQPRSEVH
ncbi:MAG TPA: alpha/beta fold hydrolase [Rudaea sp.]|jgi:dienelactone hydrolase|nr:alpha/beta fold hydrolase [Rudaea sp.]